MLIHSPGEEAFIALGKVSFAYATHLAGPVLNHIDLEVHRGQNLLICGGSGSGKSTLVRTFNGLIPHFYNGRLQGSIEIAGRSTANSSVADLFHQVGMVFQNPQAQLFNRTVAQEIIFGLESLGLDRSEMKARLKAVAADMDLEAMLTRNPQSLSGGEQQWVAIAAILVLRPHIVVLDEPMANLDAAHIQRLKGLLVRLRRQGMGIVVCEHRLVPTLPHADRVVVIEKGRKLLEGIPDQAVVDPRWPKQEIDLPLAIRLGRTLGLSPLPRDMEALAAVGHQLFPPERQSYFDRHPVEDLIYNQYEVTPPESLKTNSALPLGKPVVTVENLGYKINGRRIINNITFHLHAGQCTALVGANGAGKTTLVKLINGLLKPSSGHIKIMGQESAHMRAWQVAGYVGTAFQNPNSQFFKLTVEEEILVGPTVQQRYDEGWIDELVEIFKLKHLLGRAPFKLSGGEKKRVAFAAALAAKPEILVLDEPTAGQDSGFRRALIQCLHRLKDQGAAILVVTHALNFLETLTNRWLVLAGGELIADTTPHEIMADNTIMQCAGLAPTEAFQWKMINRNAP